MGCVSSETALDSHQDGNWIISEPVASASERNSTCGVNADSAETPADKNAGGAANAISQEEGHSADSSTFSILDESNDWLSAVDQGILNGEQENVAHGDFFNGKVS